MYFEQIYTYAHVNVVKETCQLDYFVKDLTLVVLT